MTLTLDLFQLTSLIGTAIVCVLWIINSINKNNKATAERMDKIYEAVIKLDKESVSYTYCSEKRHNCPCFKDIERVEESIKEFHQHLMKESK